MASNKRNRTKGNIRGASRNPDPWILVVTEGKVTEVSYLRALKVILKRSFELPSIPTDHGDPLTLVELAKQKRTDLEGDAKRMRDPKTRLDEVWCVFDRDEHDAPRLSQAIDNARAAGIKVAFSNPCFELWLLLHFRDQPGDQHRHRIQVMVGTFVPGYDKYVPIDVLSDPNRIASAVKRARSLAQHAEEEGDPYRSPTTSVYGLVCSLLNSSYSRSLSQQQRDFISTASSACEKYAASGEGIQ
jgi:hypothetical protein